MRPQLPCYPNYKKDSIKIVNYRQISLRVIDVKIIKYFQVNLRKHQKDHQFLSSESCPKDLGMTQHSKKCQCKPLYKQIERKTSHYHLIRCRKQHLKNSNTTS